MFRAVDRLQFVSLAILLVGCADGGTQSTFFPVGVPEGDAGTGGSDTSGDGPGNTNTSGASQATMIDPTVGLSTGEVESTTGPSGPGTTNATAVATSSESGDVTSSESDGGEVPVDETKCNAAEVELIDLVNEYRMQNGLPAVPINQDLCAVGHAHAVDLAEQGPHNAAGCGLRSWSNAGAWTPCCYTEDQNEVQCMWDKPRELTPYAANGHELAAAAGTPAAAFAMMQSDSYDNGIMLNTGIWDAFPWRSAGAGIHGGYAVVWLGPTPP